MKRIASAAIVLLCVFFVAVPPNLLAFEAEPDHHDLVVSTPESEGIPPTTEPDIVSDETPDEVTPEETSAPTIEPEPTETPTETVIADPVATVTVEPTAIVTEEPTETPTTEATETATAEPTASATAEPTSTPLPTSQTPEPISDPVSTQPSSTPMPVSPSSEQQDRNAIIDMTITPDEARQGDVVRVSGGGFEPGERVNILWTFERLLGWVYADDSGNAQGIVTVPTDLGPFAGGYYVWMIGESSDLQLNALLRIEGLTRPTAFLTPSSAYPGQLIRISGTNFIPGERVNIRWNGWSGDILGYVYPNSDGAISGVILVPRDAAPSEATSILFESESVFAWTLLEVVTPEIPEILVTPGESLPGGVVRVSGTGFVPGEQVEIRWGSSTGPLIGRVNATDGGSFSGIVTVPRTAGGGATYSIVTNSTGGTSSADLYVTVPPRPITFLSDVQGYAGDVITVTGRHYLPGETVTISWPGGLVLGRVTVNSDGRYSGKITIPRNAYASSYTITAVGNQSNMPAGARFTTLGWVEPTARVSPSRAAGGSVVRVYGSGYMPGERVDITWNGDFRIGYVTAKADGSVTGAITLPGAPGIGDHLIFVEGATSHQFSMASVFVTSNQTPTLKSTPSTVPGGTVVRVTGAGFLPGEPVTIWWNEQYGVRIGVVHASNTGSISGVVTVPIWSVKGSWSIVAGGDWSGRLATANVTVTPSPTASVSLSPTSGPRQRTVTITGRGYGSHEYVSITWGPGGSEVALAYTTQTGTFSTTFVVPSSAGSGSVRIHARGANSNQNSSAIFTVVQQAPAPAPAPSPNPSPDFECDPHYPTVCIPPRWLVGDLDCPSKYIKGEGYARFRVLQPDPHNLDADKDGIGCESN